MLKQGRSSGVQQTLLLIVYAMVKGHFPMLHSYSKEIQTVITLLVFLMWQRWRTKADVLVLPSGHQDL